MAAFADAEANECLLIALIAVLGRERKQIIGELEDVLNDLVATATTDAERNAATGAIRTLRGITR